MATPISLDDAKKMLETLDANMLQQIILERDESIERLATITEHAATIATLTADRDAVKAKLEQIDSTDEAKAKRLSEAIKIKDDAAKKMADSQAIIDALTR